MNENINVINHFLKSLSDILIQNPDFIINYEHIYHELINLNVGNDRNSNIDKYFYKWVNKFRYLDNINVSIDEKHGYFCQFTNKEEEVIKYNNNLKLFVPLDSEHIELGVEMLFDFLRKNNIVHYSKISKKIRLDDIIIRLKDKSDVIKIINYINNNNYLQDGIIKCNPFVFNKDGLGIVSDGELSYNMIVSNYIALYLNDKRQNNCLNNVSFEDFYDFILNYYNKNLINISYPKIYNDFRHNFDNNYDKNKCEDIKNITYLLFSSLSNNLTFDELIENFHNSLKIKDNSDVGDLKNIEKMTEFLIKVMLEKYVYYDIAKNNIVDYIYSGFELRLTNNYNLRKIIVSSNYRNNLLKILNNINVNIEDYIDYIYQKDIKINIVKK